MKLLMFFFQSSYFKCTIYIYRLCNGRYVRQNLTIEPTVVHIDFEVAMHAVLRGAIPSATIKCCRYHFCAKHGGGRSKLSGLVLITKITRVEPTEAEDCFTDDIIPDCPDDKKCNEFAYYLLENYVTFDSK